ncbi:MAG: type II toxin-antitoxin system VapC family toxin [Deltaproteobacteria bacterium]|nr:type II toxin-antitoxin system VapC family toxin [Deltaproteobacteria bacterium]
MTSWVVDCSLVLGWCLPDERSDRSDRFFAVLPPSAILRVPALFWYEASNALSVAARRGRIPQEECDRLSSLVAGLPLVTDPSTPETMRRLTALAVRHGLSAYDTAYLDLALRSASGLATLDDRLSDVARKVGLAVPD